ncbi:MAG: hypothetical protein JSS34_00215 [Proteobacteria bacterium]|nr:hypothetical protein [Pseudomonadota bacterium]
MGALCCFEEFTQKRFVSEIEIHLKNLDYAINFCSSVSDKGWACFNKILTLSEKDPSYWDEEETQKELQNLCNLIDVRDLAIQDNEETNLSLGSLKEFLNCIDHEHLKVSWDLLYSIDFSMFNLPLKKFDPLFPEDILGLFVVLDRMILFLREEQRYIRYNLISKHIKAFNEKDFSFLTSLNAQAVGI